MGLQLSAYPYYFRRSSTSSSVSERGIANKVRTMAKMVLSELNVESRLSQKRRTSKGRLPTTESFKIEPISNGLSASRVGLPCLFQCRLTSQVPTPAW